MGSRRLVSKLIPYSNPWITSYGSRGKVITELVRYHTRGTNWPLVLETHSTMSTGGQSLRRGGAKVDSWMRKVVRTNRCLWG